MNLYWVTTIILACFLLWSAFAYLFSSDMIKGVEALGFPDFFRVFLACLKALAAIIILIPSSPMLIKDWAYAGIFFFFITAIVAHIAHKDSPLITIINVVLIALLFISYWQLKSRS